MRQLRNLSLRALFLTLFCCSFVAAPAVASTNAPPAAAAGGVLVSGSKLLVAVQGGTAANTGVIDAGFPGVNSSIFYPPGTTFGMRVGTTNYSYASNTGITPVQNPVQTGAGTTANPWIVTSSWTIPGFQVTQTVRIVNGARSYRVTRSIKNTGTVAASFKAFEGGDLYVQGSDNGAGVYSATAPRTVGGIAADGTKAELLEVTPWTHYYEGAYQTVIGVFTASSSAVYNDTINPAANIDNGAGVQWDVNNLAAGATTDLAVTWQFVTAGNTPAPTTAPTIGTNPGTTSGPTATFSWSSTDPNTAGYQCRLDSGAYDPCTSPYTTPTLSNGSHTLQIQPINAEGNDGPIQSYTWTADTVAPDAPTFTSGPSAPVSSTTAGFTWTGAEAGGTYQCQLDGDTWTTCTSPQSYSGLTQGAHTVNVRQIDAGGNVGTVATRSWTVDTMAPAAPAVQSSSRPATVSNVSSLNLIFTGEANATFTCTLDGVASACTSPFSRSNLIDGEHQFSVFQRDQAGNPSGSAYVFWNVDTVAPGVPVLSNTPDTNTSSTSYSIGITPAEAGGDVQCRIDGAAWLTCANNPMTGSGLADGNHSLEVRQRDIAGNVSSTALAAWRVDTVAANAPTLTAFPTANTSSTDAHFAFTGESTASFRCSLDSETPAPCTSPFDRSGLPEGDHTFSVRQIDLAGNASVYNVYEWNIDTIAPDAPTVTDAPPAHSNSSSAQIVFTGAEAGGSFQCRLGSGSWVACSSPVSFSGLSDGNKTFSIRQLDAAGNPGDSTTVTWNVDTSAPGTPTVTEAPDADVNTAPTRFEFSGESGASYVCTFNGAPITCDAPGVDVSAVEGSNTFAVRQVDQAGNQGAVYTRTWTLDTAAPLAPSVDAVPAQTDADSVTVTFDGGNDTSIDRFQCRLDNGNWTTCSSPATFVSLIDGSHTVDIRAIDRSGNVGATASATTTVDTVGPTTTVSDKPAADSNVDNARFVFSASDATTAVASYECKFDNGTWDACTSPVDLTSLSEGNHTFSVRGVDDVGNRDSSPVTTSWRVDLTNPTVTLDSKPASYSSDKTPSFVVTAADAGSGVDSVECRVDGGSWTACGATYTVASDLNDGSHTFEYRATDNSGRVSDVGSYEWTVDTGATVSITSPNDNAHVSNNRPSLVFSSEEGSTYVIQRNGNTIATGTVGASGNVTVEQNSDLADGNYVYTVQVTDLASNTNDASITIVVDTVAPVKPSITDKPAAKTNINDAHFEFTGETNTSFECKLDSGSWAPCSSPQDLVSVADGDHTFSVRSVDAAGNIGAVESYSWTVDRNTSVDLVSPRPGLTGTATQTVVVTGEAGATVSIKVDGVEVATGTIDANGNLSVALDKLTDGNHTVSVVVTDGAGNTDTKEAVITVDTAAPNTATVTEQPASMSSSKTATFTFASDAGSTYKCRVDGGQYVPCSSPFTVNDLAEGPHTFSVVAIDEAGNEGARQDVSWSVDTVKPSQPPVVTGPEKKTESRNATFDVQVEPGSTLLCSVDGGAYAPCSSPITLTGLSNGSHSLKFKQVDEAGNEGAVTEYNWTVNAGGNTDSGGRPTKLNAALAGKITVRNNRQVTVGCELNRPSIRKCVVDLYTPVITNQKDVNVKLVKIGSGVTTVKAAGKRSAPVTVKLNNRGRTLLKRALGGLKVVAQVKATARTGEAFKAQLKTVLYPQAVIVMPTSSVSFAFNNAKLNKAQRSYVRSIAANVRDAKAITCVGYTDSRGSDSYNKKLATRRAKNICAALRAAGVRAKFVSIGRGEKNPRATNKTDKGRKANRRVVLTVKY